jgi:N6-adenosine-specific RNA methylase IME4
VKFATVLVDPPWQQNAGPSLRRPNCVKSPRWTDYDTRGSSRPMPYPTMSLDDIAALPVSSLATDDAHLYAWTTNRFLEATFAIVRGWGFVFSTTLVWAKNTMGGGLGGDAFGISTEFLLFARRGRLAALNRTAGSWFNWQRRYDERGKPCNSKKPAAAYAMIEHTSPGPYVELFSRETQPRLGWSYWGNESLGTASLEVVR